MFITILIGFITFVFGMYTMFAILTRKITKEVVSEVDINSMSMLELKLFSLACQKRMYSVKNKYAEFEKDRIHAHSMSRLFEQTGQNLDTVLKDIEVLNKLLQKACSNSLQDISENSLKRAINRLNYLNISMQRIYTIKKLSERIVL